MGTKQISKDDSKTEDSTEQKRKEGKRKKKEKQLEEKDIGNRDSPEDKKPKKKKKGVCESAEDVNEDTQQTGEKEAIRRNFTVSVALPGSIINNKQSDQLTAALAGYLARAMAIFRVDEVIVYNDKNQQSTQGANYLSRMLQYLETPQYLRRALIPMHPSLRLAGLLPPLDAPHHPRQHEWIPWREGATVGRPNGSGSGSSIVNVGLAQNVKVNHELSVGTRVTVHMGADENRSVSEEEVYDLVSPSQPREQGGLYWGYTVREANGLSAVFSECTYEDGYDFSIGTSERGEAPASGADLKLPPFNHLLIVFGGLHGVEESVSLDPELEVEDAGCLFDLFLNTCPGQGSRTIRCEEAVLISLAFLQPTIR